MNRYHVKIRESVYYHAIFEAHSEDEAGRIADTEFTFNEHNFEKEVGDFEMEVYPVPEEVNGLPVIAFDCPIIKYKK